MLKKILELQGVQKLVKHQQKTIHGGEATFPDNGSQGPVCFIGPIKLDCSTNTDGRCTCINGRCVKGPSTHCR
ncbi:MULTISPECIES: hypothetical protein [Aquimarina]|uniref:Uncharacterized protein n=1 Tax=Aquimarina algiphila TaxID=2047982 RepID=A0A554VLK0_9FLAO|nr:MULTISPECIES: hypothetical protein [Aquimarina]TSE09043.1 hypothetical protein FOF46_10205 [Aquimarina algiphila]